MANPQKTASTILNAIWNDASQNYQNTVPYVNANTTINEFAKPMISEAEEYEPIQNEFVKTLVNRIAFTIIEKKTWENRLARLKKGYRPPLGTDIQHIYTNPINPRKYDGNALNGILTKYDSDTKVAYYRRNREDVFPVSINREQLAGAFVSWEAFNSFVSNIVNAVYSGNEIREFNLMKQAVVDAVNDGTLITKYVEYPTADNAKDIVKELRTVSMNFEFPGSKFNKYKELAEAAGATNVLPVKTWTPSDRKVILMRTDILQALDVEVLAGAFNMTEAEFRDNLIAVDDFSYEIYNLETGTIDGHVDSDIAIVVADEALFQVYDNLKRSGGVFLDYSLTWQFFFHVWQTYGICPFANAVVYQTSGSQNLTGISVDKTLVELDSTHTTGTVTYSFIPEDFAGEVELVKISGDDIATFEIDAENKTITFTAGESLAADGEAVYNFRAVGKVFPNVVITVTYDAGE